MRKQNNIDVDAAGEEFYSYNSLGALVSQERMFKLTGPNMYENYNAGEMAATSFVDDFVLYPNPYLVVTPKGYSKHYYAGSERVASTIGGEGLPKETIIEGNKEYKNMADQLFYNTFYKQIDFINYDLPEYLETYEKGTDYCKTDHPYSWCNSKNSNFILPENRLLKADCQKDNGLVNYCLKVASIGFNTYKGTYYTHSDHLGSAAWITDQGGTAVQHMQYLPWSEVFADQRTTDYSARYTFSGKERDPETGFSYFGARYYLSYSGIFGGVDQLSDKYPSISPYAYCANNPVMLVDPDGRAHYVFKQNGEMIRNGNLPFSFDVFIIVDKNNNIIDSKSFNSTITKGFKKHTEIDNYKFIINDNDKAQELFEFFANNMNVEWLLVKNNDNNASLITSRGEDYVNVITGDVTSSSISMTHNHPTGTPYPSGMGQKGKDIEAAKFYEDKNPQMKSFLYVKGIGFLEYNSKSLGIDFNGHRDYMEDIPVIQQQK